MSKTLHLTLKGEFFDMIASGIKKQEYRELKDFWQKRLCEPCLFVDAKFHEGDDYFKFVEFDNVKFYRGWACSKKYKNMTVKMNYIDIGEPNPEWSGGMTGRMFRINLGEILEIKEGEGLITKIKT